MADRHPVRHRPRRSGRPGGRVIPKRVDSSVHHRASTPLRTCVGCRERASKSELLRVVAAGAGAGPGGPAVVPDPRGRLPGRGAYLHPVPRCLDLAERRRAFPRALRLPGPLDTTALRQWLEQPAGTQAGASDDDGRTRRGGGT
ncbi:MAG TPA: YlxR family protein [Jiangellales bacterium]|nr:YlxR family protein [Jiangellales bacterium]